MLQELKIQAGEDTLSNDFIQGYALSDKWQADVVMLDRKDTHDTSSCTMIGPVNS